MRKMPARLLAKLEHMLKKAEEIKDTNPVGCRKLVAFVVMTVRAHHRAPQPPRPATYVSANVRFRGIWRDWRDAGLQHLPDAALIRFCGFPKHIVSLMATELSKDPELASLVPSSKYWKRVDARARPSCDVLDVVVLVLRELATIGYQHQLSTDLGLHQGVLGKYLQRGKKGLLKLLRAHVAGEVGLIKDLATGQAAHQSLETQHGMCPRMGIIFVYAIDGTITPIFAPTDEDLRVLYYSGAKKVHGFNTLLLVSPLGTIHAYRVCLPGNVPDASASDPIFQMLFDPEHNPHKFGTLADYGFMVFCHSNPDLPPVVRPFMPTKDVAIPAALQESVASMSRWVTTCRQFNEWVNGSAKRGFPRWQVRRDITHIESIKQDFELYLRLYNFRVRMCSWSETRSVFMPHIEACFAEQGLVWDEAACAFDLPQGPRAEPPTDEE